jgi:Aspartyl/asparaginyl-tRNA synthetases
MYFYINFSPISFQHFSNFSLIYFIERVRVCFRKLINLANITDLQCIHDNPFIRMSYSAAVTILTRHGFDVNPDSGLSKQHELFLVKYTNNVPIFIINWPKHVKPFYMKRSGEDPDQVRSRIDTSVGKMIEGT